MDIDSMFPEDARLSQNTLGFVKQFDYPNQDVSGGFVGFVKQFDYPNQDVDNGFLNLTAEGSAVKSSFTSRLNVTTRKDCAFLTNMEQQIKSEISTAQAMLIGTKKAADKKKIQSKIDGLNAALVETRKAQDIASCASGPDISGFINNLSNEKSDKNVKIAIWGSVGLVAAVTLVVIIRKFYKAKK